MNKAILIGNLGADPETKYTQDGGAVTSIRVATSEKWKDKSSGEMQERTEWHRVVAFGRTAEVMGEYLTKGSKVAIEGRIQTRKWQDQSGQDRYTTEIVCDRLEMLSTRQDGGGQPARQAAPAAAPAPAARPALDDDIPF